MPNSLEQYFCENLTSRDRAMFELGIKLGALFHQFSGSPISNNPDIITQLTKGIEASIKSQPFVTDVQVKLKVPPPHLEKQKEAQRKDKKKGTPYDYTEISGKNLQALITLVYKNWKVIGNIEWVAEIQYPLMFISKIEKIDEGLNKYFDKY